MLFYSTLTLSAALRMDDYYYAQVLLVQGNDPEYLDGEIIERVFEMLRDYAECYDVTTAQVSDDFAIARGFEDYSAELEYEAEFEHFGAQTPYL